MTTTTRTTRKGHTARVLTAVMAVFGVLVAMLMVSAPAANATLTISDDQVSICHSTAEHGRGSDTNPYNPITVDMDSIMNATTGPNGHGLHVGPVFDATKDKFHQPSWGDIIPAFSYLVDDVLVTFPGLNTGSVGLIGTGCNLTPPPPTPLNDLDLTCTTWAVDLDQYVSGKAVVVTIDDVVKATGTIDSDGSYSESGTLPFDPHHMVVTVNAVEIGAMDQAGTCRHETEPSVSAGLTCSAWTTTLTDYPPQTAYLVKVDGVTVESGLTTQSPFVRSGAATPGDGVHVIAVYTNDRDGADYSTSVTLTCSNGLTYRQSATVNGSVDLCLADGTTGLTVAYTGTATVTSTVSDADALFLANRDAKIAADADLARQTPVGATTGACTPVTVAPVEPATVAPVEPATVAVPEAATVPVPAAAALPATVPAGDGGSIPQLPIYGWVLVVLATTALAVSAVRLAVRSTR